MRLELAERSEGTLATSGPRYTCELSFEAEAGRTYLVSLVWDKDGYLYAVTADTGTRVAGCKAQQWQEMLGTIEALQADPLRADAKEQGASIVIWLDEYWEVPVTYCWGL